MLIDLTLLLTPALIEAASRNLNKVSEGHLGTHFDVMDKVFPLEYTRRAGVVFDVTGVKGRDVEASDIDVGAVGQDMFVAFCSRYIEEEGYGSVKYFSDHPQLSYALIDALLDKGVSIIGVDFSGMRNGRQHTAADQYCADHGVFVVENLCNLKAVLNGAKDARFTAHTYPMNFSERTGLQCRVVAEI